MEVGGDGAWHTQICDAVIAKRSNNTSDPIMTVYAVTHTSVDILATFTVQRNVTTNKIEVEQGSSNPNIIPTNINLIFMKHFSEYLLSAGNSLVA